MQLNFAKYRRGGQYSYKMLEPGRVQIPGFTDSDVYADVVAKGAKGLGIEDPTDNLRLIVSSGLVMDSPLSSGKRWTLGEYVAELGGAQVRGKRTFGICIPDSEHDDEEGVSISLKSDYRYFRNSYSCPQAAFGTFFIAGTICKKVTGRKADTWSRQ